MARFILRQEYFGGTLMDRETLRTFSIDETAESILRSGASIQEHPEWNPQEIDVLPANEDRENLPRGVLRAPTRLYFEITRKCNLRCTNCFSASGLTFPDELTHEEVERTLTTLRRDQVLEARLTGGEPTQRPGWDDLVAHALDIGMAVSLNTNGCYTKHYTAERIVELGPDQVIVSLDGEREAHEHLRGRGTFGRTLENIKYFSEHLKNVRINTLLREETIPSIPAMTDIAESVGAEMCFILLRPIGRGEQLFDTIPHPHILYGAVQEVKRLRAERPGMRIMTSYDVIQTGANRPAPDCDLTGCAAGLRGMNINSRGRMDCCGFLAELTDDYSPGNIRDTEYSVLKSWRSSPQMAAFRERNLQTNKQCTGCELYANECFGSCVVMDIYKDLNRRRKDPYCLIDHESVAHRAG